jgi:C4-dicarboxylate transporter DctM subunit
MSGAFVFNYAVANENVPQLLRNTLVAWNLPPLAFLLSVNVLLLLLAVAIDEITILLVIVPLLVPVAEGLGINLVHFGVIIMMNMMVGLALPPHGLLLFVISGLTGTPIGAIFRETPPFIFTLIAVMLIATLVPDVVLWLPRLFKLAV